jgi:hypothetical protein
MRARVAPSAARTASSLSRAEAPLPEIVTEQRNAVFIDLQQA